MELTARERGFYLGLEECEKAYQLGGENRTWSDYIYEWYNKLSDKKQTEDRNLYNPWVLSKYYSDFESWWIHLSETEQKRILKELGYDY